MLFNGRYIILFQLILATAISHRAEAQDTQQASPVTFGASYIGDALSNVNGGIQTGATFLGMANINLSFNTEDAGWWKGGEFFINGMNTHGGEPTGELIGDFQGVSNIEAGDLTALYELWYRQEIWKLTLIVGLQDLNAEYATSEYGALYINSSFGIHSTIADNTPTPLFPLTRPGLTLKYCATENLIFQAAIYDGLLHEEDANDYNLNWNLKSDNGALYAGEIQSTYDVFNELPSTVKIGVCYHNRHLQENKENVLSYTDNNYTLYLNIDQKIFNNAQGGGLGAFTQIGVSSASVNNNSGYLGLGLNYSGFSEKRPNDELGLAAANSKFETNRKGYESTIELTYKMFINEHFFIQPDIQYVINPSGTEVLLENATVGIVRLGLNF